MSLSDTPDLPLPQKGQKLFVRAPDWEHNAWLGRTRVHQSWDVYAEGFKLAADQLVEDLLEGRVYLEDFLVYPVVFLYRQYLELRLKDLIVVSARRFRDVCRVPPHHDLMLLWGVVRPRLERVWSGKPARERHDAIEERLREFCAVDRSSCAFRYPIDRSGKASVDGLQCINLPHLKDMIAGMSTILDSSSFAMMEMANFNDEMRAEMQSEMAEFYEP